MLSFDYARKLDVPVFADEITEGFLGEQECLRRAIFGIVHEGVQNEDNTVDSCICLRKELNGVRNSMFYVILLDIGLGI